MKSAWTQDKIIIEVKINQRNSYQSSQQIKILINSKSQPVDNQKDISLSHSNPKNQNEYCKCRFQAKQQDEKENHFFMDKHDQKRRNDLLSSRRKHIEKTEQKESRGTKQTSPSSTKDKADEQNQQININQFTFGSIEQESLIINPKINEEQKIPCKDQSNQNLIQSGDHQILQALQSNLKDHKQTFQFQQQKQKDTENNERDSINQNVDKVYIKGRRLKQPKNRKSALWKVCRIQEKPHHNYLLA